MMEIAITKVYDQLELYQIVLQSNPLFEPTCTKKLVQKKLYS